jgi:hypothetical protein
MAPSPHPRLDEIKRELSAFLPPDRVGGLLTLEQERWLVEALDVANELDAQHLAEAERLYEQLEAAQSLCRELYDVFYPHLDESERTRLRAVVKRVAPNPAESPKP